MLTFRGFYGSVYRFLCSVKLSPLVLMTVLPRPPYSNCEHRPRNLSLPLILFIPNLSLLPQSLLSFIYLNSVNLIFLMNVVSFSVWVTVGLVCGQKSKGTFTFRVGFSIVLIAFRVLQANNKDIKIPY